MNRGEDGGDAESPSPKPRYLHGCILKYKRYKIILGKLIHYVYICVASS